MPLYQIGKNRWTNRPPEQTRARSELPMPMIISDEMPALEQVDGKFYTSKRQYRAVGRAHGLTEVGNEKPKPRPQVEDKDARKRSIKTAIEKYRAGHRPRPQPGP